MDISSVCIVGGSGFIGRAVADHACQRGLRVRVLTRYAPKAWPITVLPTVEIMVADTRDEKSLEQAFADMDAVVNLVGILHPSHKGSFKDVHVELPRRVARACHAAGVQQLLHMSALGASRSGPSEYLRTKAEGEEAVREAAGILAATIFRPSVVFGEKDRFLNLFAKLVRLFPVIPLAGAKARFQPIWVEDVARAFLATLGNPRAFGQTYELAGPRAYTLEELVRFVAATLGKKRTIVALPAGLANLQAFVFEHLPGKLMTRDNLRSMSVDNVASGTFPGIFGFQPAALEAIAPEYLAGTITRARYPRYRHNAGR